MSNNLIIIIGAVLIVAILLWWLLPLGGAKKTTDSAPKDIAQPLAAVVKADVPASKTAKAPVKTAATKKAAAPKAAAPKAAAKPAPVSSIPENLELIKGLGPKVNTLLKGLGVTSFAQVASWTAADVSEIDAQLGAFAGRITRDNWIDQAQLLAAGDVVGFEQKYGALGMGAKG